MNILMSFSTQLIVCSLFYRIDGQILNVLDEDIYRTSVEFIESRGFKAETHTVITQDLYILTVFRIINPYISGEQRNKSLPVLLWPGIAATSDSWLISRPGFLNNNGIYSEDNQSVVNNCDNNITSTLSYTLAACGYDVWLSNNRGGRYSNKHKKLNELEYVSYIGHSMATTTMFILLSLIPEFERFIKPFIAMAPVVYFGNVKSDIVNLAALEPIVRSFKFPLGLSPKRAEWLGAYICGQKTIIDTCIQRSEQTYGSDPYNLDKNRFPVYLANSLDKISIRVYLHFAQLINSKLFHKFNYPTIYENYKKYRQMRAPDYPINKISSKNIVIIEAKNDYLSDSSDINKLVKQMKVPLLANHTITWKYWNHPDYIWAINANKYLNPIILKTLDDIN